MTILGLAAGRPRPEVRDMDSAPRRPTSDPAPEFTRRVAAVLQRGLEQTGQPAATTAEVERVAAALASIGAEGGAACRRGASGPELPDALVRGGVDRLLAAAPGRGPAFAALAKQLVKACFQPGPAQCRLSYRETDSAGRCRRQELAYASARLSGTHCVDCPYWSMDRSTHRAWLADQWHAGAAALAAHEHVFLPEDFRTLRNESGPSGDETSACG